MNGKATEYLFRQIFFVPVSLNKDTPIPVIFVVVPLAANDNRF